MPTDILFQVALRLPLLRVPGTIIGRKTIALQINLLETSFRAVEARGEAFTAAFYDHLFRFCPETKPLFADTDLALQYRKLLGALTLVIEHLREPEALTPLLYELGQRHLTAYRI